MIIDTFRRFSFQCCSYGGPQASKNALSIPEAETCNVGWEDSVIRRQEEVNANGLECSDTISFFHCSYSPLSFFLLLHCEKKVLLFGRRIQIAFSAWQQKEKDVHRHVLSLHPTATPTSIVQYTTGWICLSAAHWRLQPQGEIRATKVSNL